MPYRPKVKNSDGTLTDLPLEAETAVKLKTSRSIGLSGVTANAQSFNGTSAITIPVTAVPATLLTGTASISTTGEAGSAKNYNTSTGTIKTKFDDLDGKIGKLLVGSTYYSGRSTTSTTDTGSTGYITFII